MSSTSLIMIRFIQPNRLSWSWCNISPHKNQFCIFTLIRLTTRHRFHVSSSSTNQINNFSTNSTKSNNFEDFGNIEIIYRSKMRITILGAGIAGVTTGLQIQSAFPNANVNITAEYFNSDTLSAGAAGIFRPGSGLRCADNGQDVGAWLTSSYNYYSGILASVEAAKAGVMRVDGYLFSSGEESVVRNAYLERLLPVYRMATEDEVTQICPDLGFKHGAYFQTMVIESEKFLPWGLQKFKENGGSLTHQRIESFQDLQQSADWIINCTGLGARKLCQDNRLVPIRGQVFKVHAPWVKMFYYGDYDTYVIPTSTTVTLGGTRNFDSWNTKSDPHDAASIMERCTKLLPNLKNAQIIKSWVGLRPYRDQVRVEFDTGLWKDKGIRVVHNYSHGGYGVTSAPGTGEEVVRILQEKLRSGTTKSRL